MTEQRTTEADQIPAFLAGKGEMRRRIREFDWKSVGLGPPSTWPMPLTTAVSIMLDSAAPMYISWGPRFIQFYNDAYIPVLGSGKHPVALGRTTPETWHEIWEVIGPLFQQVIDSAEAVSRENFLLPVVRNGYPEECYFTFSYSPLRSEEGKVEGVLVTVWESTGEFVSKRRNSALQMLTNRLSGIGSRQGIRQAFEATVRAFPRDLPFALWYEADDAGKQFELVAAAGIPRGSVFAPLVIERHSQGGYGPLLDACSAAPVIHAIDGSQPESVEAGGMTVPPRAVCIKSLDYGIAGGPHAYLIVAFNPLRHDDEAQKSFYLAIRVQLENAVRRVGRQELECRQREHQFDSVMSVLPCLVWMSDPDGNRTYFNKTWLAFRGRTLEQELGDGWREGIHPDEVAELAEARKRLVAPVHLTLEYRMRLADGEYRWLLAKVSPRFDVNGEFLGSIGTCIDITERKAAEQGVLFSQAEMRELYDLLQAMRQEERQAIAREVHDQLGQILSAAKIDIKLLEDDIKLKGSRVSKSVLLTELDSAQRSIDAALHSARRISRELRAPELDEQGLFAAMQWHARDFERRTRVQCRVQIAPDLREPTGQIALAMFRVFQESLTNVLRHAQASAVEVRILRRGQGVLMRVLDDGIGIKRRHLRGMRGIGIQGMRERAELLGGRLVVGRLFAHGASGTLVAMRVPFLPHAVNFASTLEKET